MEVTYSATTSEWLGIVNYKGQYIVVSDSYEYKLLEDAIVFCGTYEACKKYVTGWYAETTIRW